MPNPTTDLKFRVEFDQEFSGKTPEEAVEAAMRWLMRSIAVSFVVNRDVVGFGDGVVVIGRHGHKARTATDFIKDATKWEPLET